MNALKIQGATALVTGANRGIGRAITQALLDRGAAKVYAGARNPETLSGGKDPAAGRLVPLRLDVTDEGQVEAAARTADDISILVNNAGVALGGVDR